MNKELLSEILMEIEKEIFALKKKREEIYGKLNEERE